MDDQSLFELLKEFKRREALPEYDTAFINRFIQESNSIEGEDSQEAYRDAQEAWQLLMYCPRITNQVILKAHEKLMCNLNTDIAGRYRTVPVYIYKGSEKIRTCPNPKDISRLLSNLLKRWKIKTPLEALKWHLDFEKIHPFVDGNGRIGRLLYLWHCIIFLKKYPILFTKKHRGGYYALF